MRTLLRRFMSETPGLYWDELASVYGNTFNMVRHSFLLLHEEPLLKTCRSEGILGGDVIWTRDPAWIKAILTDPSFTNYEKGEWLDGIIGDFLGRGIFNSDGDMWRGETSGPNPAQQTTEPPLTAHRSMTRPFFAKERISDFNTFGKHSDQLLKVIARLSSAAGSSPSHANGAVEIQDLFGRFTLDVATEFLMNGSIVSSYCPGNQCR
jgi:hypothetical protein